MDSIPAELLSRIMINVLPPRPPDPSDIGFHAPKYDSGNHPINYWSEYWLPVTRTEPQAHGPIQLSLVSRLWKHVAENTPELWTRIAVDIDSTRGQNISDLVFELSMRLSRSGALPLDVRFAYWDRFEDLDLSDASREVLDEIHLHSSRFRSVSLHVDPEVLMRAGYHRHRSPGLTHLSIHNYGGDNGIDYYDFSSSFPSLKSLILWKIPLASLSFAHTSLTYLKLSRMAIPLPWHAIQHATRLVRLAIEQCEIEWDDMQPPAVIERSVVLRNIVHFDYIPGDHCPDEFHALQAFDMPSLRFFQMKDDTIRRGEYINKLAWNPFVRSCANSLQHLALFVTKKVLGGYSIGSGPFVSDCNSLIHVLALLPALIGLVIGFDDVPQDFFSPLLVHLSQTADGEEGRPLFLPKLRTIMFSSEDGIFWPLLPGIFRRTGSPNQRLLQHLIIRKVDPAKSQSRTDTVVRQLILLARSGILLQFYDHEGRLFGFRSVVPQDSQQGQPF